MEVTPEDVRPGAPPETRLLTVREASQVGEARRTAAALAARRGLDENVAGKLALIVTEAAGNLVKHAGGGELAVRPLDGPPRAGIEVIALDRGPGITDIGKALQDGVSSAGTSGTGLGAIRRLSDVFDLYSSAGRGSAVLSRLYVDPPAPDPPPLETGVICLAKAGEDVSGDSWQVAHRPDGARVLVVDGLGHGPDAHQAAVRALSAARMERGGPAAVVTTCHDALHGTRGAALAVTNLDLGQNRVRFAGVGNVVAVVSQGDRRQNMVSTNGTAGLGKLRVREFEYRWEPGSLLVMASDGLGTRWSLDDYPGLAARHPALVAAVLYRDHTRGRDDVTVLVVRERPRLAGAVG